jgi:hypothetical protein
MHIKIYDKPYQNDTNLAEIINLSGECLNGADCIEVDESHFPGIIQSKHNILWDKTQKKIVYKTQTQKDQEIVIKTQNKLLNQFKPLMDAMTFQEISILKGSDPSNAMFTDTEIKEWGDYISQIANGNVTATMPAIPVKYQGIIG